MKYILIVPIFITFIGCNPSITKEEFAPQMYVEHPTSILVLPPINKSTAADAKDYYLTTVAEPLTNSGYYVYPIEIVSDVLKQEGLSDTETMLNVPPQKFREFFGADAVMYVTILKWNTSYLIVSGSVTVQIECEIKSTKTGATIWYYNDEISVNTSGDSGNAGGLAGLLIQAATTAIKTAATDYVPVAKDVNTKILLAIPFGKYNKEFNRDMKTKIELKKKSEKK
ncbi:MAG: DUF799 family lipoprotein [Bacteroidota bacterium]|nr:DUF799 family lipoprotein [Bacteroidota bacterium]